MSDRSDGYRPFRLNLDQQRKRAKELLAAARAGDAAAIARIDAPRAAAPAGAASPGMSSTSSPGASGPGTSNPGTTGPRLADAQRAIARELRFETWAALKRHSNAMAVARGAVESAAASRHGAPDADRRTLHVRCGSDIRAELGRAGFGGDFYEHSYPYLIGPVREGPGCLEQRARFLATSYGSDLALDYETALRGLQQTERQLQTSARYERVVIWSERDCYDQLVLVRLLGHYAEHDRPASLELINVGQFPGTVPFIGLGQLPPEALLMLWPTRVPADESVLGLGLAAWRALASPDPRGLAAIMRTGTPALPLLAPALRRHLSELPSVFNGLSLTEQLALGLLADTDMSLQTLFVTLAREKDPLPGQGDLQVRDRVLALGQSIEPMIERRPGSDRHGRARPPWTDVLSITPAGRAVLRGEIDYLTLAPPSRWVGGVEVGGRAVTGRDVGPAQRDWRWDEATLSVVLRDDIA